MLLSFLSNLLSHVFFLFGYISSNNLFPEPLIKTEEEFYLRKYFAGDKNARDKLIEHNLRLVAHIAKRYSNSEQELEDLISIGIVGLIKAIDSFSAEKGFKISTYASKCVENEILMHIRATKKIKSEVSMNTIIGTDKDGNDIFVYHARSLECFEGRCGYSENDPLHDPCRHARVRKIVWE